nr:hypothetical protein [uncultured Draconibacterium sp.]
MKTYLSILITFLLIAMASCVQDEAVEDVLSENDLLKSHEIEEGKYRGILGRAAEWYISLPEGWEEMHPRYMIFYAHGLQDPGEGPNLPSDTISNRSIEDIITGMGLGYATTSYRDDGFIADDAVEDIQVLRKKVFKVLKKMPPDFTILGGPSEGGLVTALTLERYPTSFNGALSICGPIGSFFEQLQYNGNFHVLFNYFFGADLAALGYSTGSPLGVGEAIMDQWRSGELPAAVQAILTTDLMQGGTKLFQLLTCAEVPVDMTDPVAMVSAALQCLRYNIMITDDLIDRLDGIVPFNNMETGYSGSLNDEALNNNILRVNENSYLSAMMSVKKYETTGDIQIPFVTIHTTGDHVTPFWHNEIYRTKILSNGNEMLHTSLPVSNYGHCTVEESDIVAGLGIVMTKITLMP